MRSKTQAGSLAAFGGFVSSASGTVAAALQTRDHNVEAAIALDLSLEPIEQVALELGDLPAAEACHVDVIALRPPLIKVLLALHVHQIKLVNKSMALEKI